MYYLPLYFQFVSFDTALFAAVRLLPFVIFFVVTNMLSGWILPRVKWYSILYVISSIFILISGGLFYTLTPETPKANVYGYSILTGIGAGLVCQTGYSIATVKAPSSDAVNAISLQNVSQIGSTVIGLVISGQVFQSVAFRNLSSVLAGMGFSSEEIRSAVAGTTSVIFESLEGAVREEAVAAITGSLDMVFTLVIVAGGLTLFAGLGMRREKLA